VPRSRKSPTAARTRRGGDQAAIQSSIVLRGRRREPPAPCRMRRIRTLPCAIDQEKASPMWRTSWRLGARPGGRLPQSGPVHRIASSRCTARQEPGTHPGTHWCVESDPDPFGIAFYRIDPFLAPRNFRPPARPAGRPAGGPSPPDEASPVRSELISLYALLPGSILCNIDKGFSIETKGTTRSAHPESSVFILQQTLHIPVGKAVFLCKMPECFAVVKHQASASASYPKIPVRIVA
jgi:hypothetical protein